ncbi:type IV pilus assembly protein PilM [Candidatus Azambacteria bacterium]|nr:type IV pilus assembly protein PilM [Candidatus Azambacteria bacterium]
MFKFLLKSLYSIDPESFGLDISDRSLKFAQLRKTNKGFYLSAFGSQDIKEGIIQNGEIKNEDALAEIIKNAVASPIKGKLTTNHVVFSLPEEHSFLRVLQIPNMSHDETAEAIKWEIEQNIPLGIDEVYFDWQVIENSGSAQADHQDIFIAAIPKNVADPYISTLTKAGLTHVSMEPESVSVARSVVKNAKTESPVFILDIGSTTTSFVIFSGNVPRFSSSSQIAGKKMIDAIKSNLGVDEAEAIRLFNEVGFDKKLDTDGKVTEAIAPLFDNIIAQMDNYISFYGSHSVGDNDAKKKSFEKIILSGGVANLFGASGHIAGKVGIKTELANPWSNILKEPLREVPDLSYRQSLGYTTALGLALRGSQNIS